MLLTCHALNSSYTWYSPSPESTGACVGKKKHCWKTWVSQRKNNVTFSTIFFLHKPQCWEGTIETMFPIKPWTFLTPYFLIGNFYRLIKSKLWFYICMISSQCFDQIFCVFVWRGGEGNHSFVHMLQCAIKFNLRYSLS